MNGSVVNLFAQRGALVTKDVTPWQTISGKGMRFHLQSYNWDNCANVSHLSMRAFFGLMKMETLICTPYLKDLPLFSYDRICLFGKESLLLEVYDTQVEPIDLSSLDAVKMSHQDLKDKKLKPAWYDSLRLSPCTFKVGPVLRLAQLSEEMTTAYLNLFPTARTIDLSVKNARNSSYVERLSSKGGPAINTMRRILGDESAETLFRRFIFGTQ